MSAGSDHHDDDHGHGDDHATGGDAWVLVPLAVGLVVGLVLAVVFGLGSDVASFT